MIECMRSSPAIISAAGRWRLPRRCFSLSFAVTAFIIASGSASCSSSIIGSACASAGGTCVVGVAPNCAKQAPTSAQDCQSNHPTEAGGLCCLEFQEGGLAPDSGVGSMSDSGGMTADAANGSPSIDGSGAPVSEAEADTSADAEAGTDAGGEAGPLPACTWPANLDSTDASAAQCVAARSVSCFMQTASGQLVGFGCSVTNDPTTCDSTAGFDCWSGCMPSEYGVDCASNSGPTGSPPVGCRQGNWDLVAYPRFYCCPCGVPGDASHE
jgi:hypothetical protein